MIDFMKRLVFAVPAAVGAVILLILSFSADVAEYVFARGIFRGLSSLIGFVSGLFPFSVTEFALYAGIVGLILLILKKVRVRKVLHISGWVLSFAFLLYVLLHGANFYRYQTSDLLNLEEDISTQDLYRVCSYTAQQATELRMQTQEDEQGRFRLREGVQTVLTNTNCFYEVLQSEYDFLYGSVNRVKDVLISPLWSYTGITGMYMPLFAEANVNTDIPESELYMTAAHELAHTKGFARENECNFWAYLACMQSKDTDARYSAYLFAYRCLSAELYKQDRVLYQAAAVILSQEVRADICESYEYWQAHSGIISDAGEQINDTFIKAQGQADGIASYNRAALLIAAYEIRQGR